MKSFKVAVVGATGAVGREMIRFLIKRQFPIEFIKPLASHRSAHTILEIESHAWVVEELTEESFDGIDLAFFAAGAKLSAQYVPIAVKKGAIVIDNSSYFRMNPDVPLVVPDVNPEALFSPSKIIANPNCSTAQMVSVLKPLHDQFHLTKIIVSTYQAVSGAGQAAVQELQQQMKSFINNKPMTATVLPVKDLPVHYPIVDNVIPQIDVFMGPQHDTKEEWKMVQETQKILDPTLDIWPMCVRVPVTRGHSESLYLESQKPFTQEGVYEALMSHPGITLLQDDTKQVYPLPRLWVGRDDVGVGRIRLRPENPHQMMLWIVADNLLKGAATNAIQIAEKLQEIGRL